MTKFKTQWNVTPKGVSPYEKPNHSPSMTIEGETRDIKTLIKQMANGMIPLQRNYDYIDTEDVDNMTSLHRQPLDLTELDDIRNKAAADRAAIEAHEAKKAADKAAKKAEADKAEAVEKYIAEQNKKRKDGTDNSSGDNSGR